MTTVAVLADLHGNLPALEAVERDLADLEVDVVVVAGDLVNPAPFPAEVLARVTALGWLVIRGNHEFYLLDYGTPRARPEWSDRARFVSLGDLQAQVGEQWRTAIGCWPDSLSLRFPDAPPLLVVHGTPATPWRGLGRLATDGEVREAMANVEESTVVVAHTHLPWERRVDRWQVVNPGATGLPLDGLPGAPYALLRSFAGGWRVEHRRAPYDVAPLIAAFDRAAFVERRGVIGWAFYEEFRTRRPHIVPLLRWLRATAPERPIGWDLLADFARADRWAFTPPDYHVNRDALP